MTSAMRPVPGTGPMKYGAMNFSCRQSPASANYERAAGVDGLQKEWTLERLPAQTAADCDLHQRNQRDLATVHQNHDLRNAS